MKVMYLSETLWFLSVYIVGMFTVLCILAPFNLISIKFAKIVKLSYFTASFKLKWLQMTYSTEIIRF